MECNKCGEKLYSQLDKAYAIINENCWECDEEKWNSDDLSTEEFEKREAEAMNLVNYEPKDEEWFKDRIGETIYRDARPEECCETCSEVVDQGLEVRDEQHAHYLAATDREFANCGTFLNYRDNK